MDEFIGGGRVRRVVIPTFGTPTDDRYGLYGHAAGRGGRYWWVFGLLWSHFRVQYLFRLVLLSREVLPGSAVSGLRCVRIVCRHQPCVHSSVSWGRAGEPSCWSHSFPDGRGAHGTVVGTHPLPSRQHVAEYTVTAKPGVFSLSTSVAHAISRHRWLVARHLSGRPQHVTLVILFSAARQTGLVDSSRGRGLQSTGPVRPLGLRIPIDHCLVSAGVVVHDKQIGPDVGSDHLPLMVDLAVADNVEQVP